MSEKLALENKVGKGRGGREGGRMDGDKIRQGGGVRGRGSGQVSSPPVLRARYSRVEVVIVEHGAHRSGDFIVENGWRELHRGEQIMKTRHRGVGIEGRRQVVWVKCGMSRCNRRRHARN